MTAASAGTGEAADRELHGLGIEDVAFRYLGELSGGRRQ